MNSTFSFLLLATLLASLTTYGNPLPAKQGFFTLTTIDREYNARMAALEKAEKRLIKTGPNQPAKWMTLDEITQLALKHQGFMDVTLTGDYIEEFSTVKSSDDIPTDVIQQETARAIMKEANTDLMRSTLKTLTGFPTRHYRSASGVKSADWLFQLVQQIAADNQLKVTVNQFSHSGWDQKSLTARIEGSENSDEIIIFGAHQDSVNWREGLNSEAPGADDDGSGTVTILEAFRAILATKYRPKRSIEFQWYSGEEFGLLGSQDIANAYKANNINVKAMLQLDMTGFVSPSFPSEIGLIDDYTDSRLTLLVEKIVKAYTQLIPKRYNCGYGCSDHASWNKNGYPSVYPFETLKMQNRNIHTRNDTFDSVNFDRALEFVKIAIGFAVELTM